jgi:hypothetical protein
MSDHDLTVLARARLSLMGIRVQEADFARRGFALAAARERLEASGRAFIHGYRLALVDDRASVLDAALAHVESELRGFAYEGAAMGVTLRDALAPWRTPRAPHLLTGPHCYMAHIGAGWAFARLHRGPAAVQRMDTLLCWLALDGYGFHQGFFHPRSYVHERRRERGFRGYAARAFDQGLGRCLWFVEAGEPEPIARVIARFELGRRADLWSGVALAATYAGGVSPQALEVLAALGGAYAAHMAQGAAFAVSARRRAGNPATHSDLACRILSGHDAATAADATDEAARNLAPDGAEPAYELWRARLRAALDRAPALERHR